MSCVNCGESVHGPSKYCPACGHPQQAAVAVLEPGREPPTTEAAGASDRHPITGRLLAAATLYFLLSLLPAVMIPGFVGAVGSAFLEAAGLALVPATVVRRAGAMALAVLTALAWTGLSYAWSYDALNVATIALVTLQFVAWLVATRRRGLPYVLIVAVLVLAFLLNVVFGAVGVYGLVVQGALWAVLGLVAAWMPVPAQRAETAGGPVRAGGAPSAGSETSTLAVAAFVVSFFVALAGIVLGHMALGEIRRTGKRGHGLAVTALVIGYGAIALILIAVLAFLAGTGSGS